MAELKRYPGIWHWRAEQSAHVLRYRGGKLVESGRGLEFWFRPLNTSIAEVPMDDHEVPFLFHGRTSDFQDATVQGAITFRVADPEKLAGCVDFTIDLRSGAYLKKPIEKIVDLFTELTQQLAWEYVAHTDLKKVLAEGVETIRQRVIAGLSGEPALTAMGLQLGAVRIAAVRPTPEVEKALQVPVREAIQQAADEATFQRRALAVEKERAIQENELENKIELARREEKLIERRGANEMKRVTDEAASARVAAAAQAERTGIAAHAEAESITAVQQARVKAEQDRMQIYREFPTDRLLGLAAQRLAGNLKRIDHINLTPDLLRDLLTNLAEAGTARLRAEAKQ